MDGHRPDFRRVIGLDTEIAVYIERGIDQRAIGELQLTGRIDSLPIARKFIEPEGHVETIGEIVEHNGVAYKVRHVCIFVILVATAETQLDTVRKFRVIDVSVHAEAQPPDPRFKALCTEVIASRGSILQTALHPETEIDVECGIVAGILDVFEVFNLWPFVALTLGDCLKGHNHYDEHGPQGE